MGRKKVVAFVLLASVQAVVFIWGLWLGLVQGSLAGFLSAGAMLLAFVMMAYDGHKIRVRKKIMGKEKK